MVKKKSKSTKMVDDEAGSPEGFENYEKMYNQKEPYGDPKKKDGPVTMILEKETIEYINKPKKKSKGGMIIGKGADYIKDLI